MAERKIKVAQIVGDIKLGGVASVVMNYYAHMDRDKFRFDFFTYGPSESDEKIRALGGNVFYLPNFIKFGKATAQLKKYLRGADYDIVHSHITSLSVFPLKAAKECGVTVRIAHAHSTAYRYDFKSVFKNSLKRFSAKYATHLLACGEHSGRWLFGKKYDGAVVLRNAVDTEIFAPDEKAGAEFKKKYEITGRTLGFAGRFAYQKNLFFLLGVFKEVLAETDATLLLLGDGKDKDRLIKKAKKLGIYGKCVITKPDGLRGAYNAMDVFCLPSRFEGLPVVAVEAQSCGTGGVYSDKISRECDIAGDNSFLKLNKKLWKKEILRRLDSVTLRKDCRPALEKAGYGIRREASALEKIYTDALNKVNK